MQRLGLGLFYLRCRVVLGLGLLCRREIDREGFAGFHTRPRVFSWEEFGYGSKTQVLIESCIRLCAA